MQIRVGLIALFATAIGFGCYGTTTMVVEGQAKAGEKKDAKPVPTLIADGAWKLDKKVGFEALGKILWSGLSEKGELLSVDDQQVLTFWGADGTAKDLKLLQQPATHVTANTLKSSVVGSSADGKKLLLFDAMGSLVSELEVEGEVKFIAYREGNVDVVIENKGKVKLKTFTQSEGALSESKSLDLPDVAGLEGAYFKRGSSGRVLALLVGPKAGAWVIADPDKSEIRTKVEFTFASNKDYCAELSLERIAYRKGGQIEVVSADFAGEPVVKKVKDAAPKDALWYLHGEFEVLYLSATTKNIHCVDKESNVVERPFGGLVSSDSPVERMSQLVSYDGRLFVKSDKLLVPFDGGTLGDEGQSDFDSATGLNSKRLATFFSALNGRYVFHYEAGKNLRILDTSTQKVTEVDINEDGANVQFVADGIRLAPWFTESSPHFLVARQIRKESDPYRVFSIETGKEIMREYKGKEIARYTVWLSTANYLDFLPEKRVLLRTGQVCAWDKLENERKRRVNTIRVLDGILDPEHGAGNVFLSGDNKRVLRLAPNNKSKKLSVRLIDVESGKISSTEMTSIEYDSAQYSMPEDGWTGVAASSDLSHVLIAKDNGRVLGVLDSASGKLLWSEAKVSQDCAPVLTRDGKHVVFVDAAGKVVVRDAKSGALAAQVDCKFKPVGMCEGAGGTIIAANGETVARWTIK